jgi:hypothetical protein
VERDEALAADARIVEQQFQMAVHRRVRVQLAEPGLHLEGEFRLDFLPRGERACRFFERSE